MTYKTHIAFAIAPVVSLQALLDIEYSHYELFLFIAIAIGALLPDLDEEGSYIGEKFPIFALLYGMYGIEHRELTHRAIFLVILTLIGLFISLFIYKDFVSRIVVFGLLFGYLMHLLGDMLTKGGINKFFYPVSEHKAVLLPRKFRFYTGSDAEWFVFLALLSIIFLSLFLIV